MPLELVDRSDAGVGQPHHHRLLLAALEDRDHAKARSIVEIMLTYSEQAILGKAEQLEAEGKIGPKADSRIRA